MSDCPPYVYPPRSAVVGVPVNSHSPEKGEGVRVEETDDTWGTDAEQQARLDAHMAQFAGLLSIANGGPSTPSQLSFSEALRAMHTPSAVVNIHSRAFRAFSSLTVILAAMACFCCIAMIATPLTRAQLATTEKGYTTVVDVTYWCFTVSVQMRARNTVIVIESDSLCGDDRPYRCDAEKYLLFAAVGLAIASLPPLFYSFLVAMSATVVKSCSPLGRAFDPLSKGLMAAKALAVPLLIAPSVIGFLHWTTTTEWCPANPNPSFKQKGYSIGPSPFLGLAAAALVAFSEAARFIFFLLGIAPRAGQACPYYGSCDPPTVAGSEFGDRTALLSTASTDGAAVNDHGRQQIIRL